MRRVSLRTWRQAIFEILIVTLGILLAFGLDAAWDSYVDGRRERTHLQALAVDFQRNVELLEQNVRNQQRIIEASRALLAIAKGGRVDPVAPRLMDQVFSSRQFEPVMGAYEELVGAGGLTVISNSGLRSGLAQFAAVVRGRYSERFSEQLYFAFVREFIGRGVGSMEPTAELLADSRFQEYLSLRSVTERDVGENYSELLELAKSIVSRCRSEMGE
jgi:hypothetical protein